uniref:Thioredoxin domain-containing protein n=1 Tax=Ditylenchus dipsaci TaxID=166011 RepID=A0A915CUI1_9BILA
MSNNLFEKRILGLTFFLVANCFVTGIQEEDGILDLNITNIQEALVEHEYLLVLYYKSSCPASRDFLSKLPDLGKHLKKIDSSVHLAKFEDHTQYVHKVNHQNPIHYPALILHFGNNQWTEYEYEDDDQRDYQSISLWLEDFVGEDVLFGRDQKKPRNNSGSYLNVPSLVTLNIAVWFTFYILY